MTFVPDFSEIEPEVRIGVADVVSFFPKVPGTGNVLLSTAPTFTVHDPAGKQLGSGTASLQSVGTPAISRVDVQVPAIETVDEGYQVRLKWREDGGVERLEVITFSVVMHPFDETTVGKNDLIQLRPAAFTALQDGARRLGQSVDQFASLLGFAARSELIQRVNAQAKEDRADYQDPLRNIYGHDHGFLRGYMILNRARLKRVEVRLALAELYATVHTRGDEDDGSANLHEFYMRQADRAWRSVELRYDFAGNDLVEDGVIRKSGTTLRMRRVQSR